MTRATGKATYGYDGLGHRVSVVGTDGVNRVQVYSQDGQLLYAGAAGSTGTRYVYLHRHVIAEVGAAGTTYDHTDGLGSPVAQTNAVGTVLNRTSYEPYGYVAAGSPRTIGFTGHVNDNDTGLIYMQQRYYDAFAGRMLGIDPVVTDANTGGSFNRYSYANNSPYKYVDPDGRAAETVFDAASRALSIAIYKSDPSLLNGLGVAIDGLAMAVPFVPGGVGVIRSVGRGAEASKAAEKGVEDGRAANKLRPVKEAEGAHSAFKRGSDGKITNTATYTPNPKNPSGFDEAKRVDVTGKAHTNSDGTKVDTPHVHEAGMKDVRPAKPEELPSK